MSTELTKKRIESLDFLRGLVMIIMALDHTRDYFYLNGWMSDPTNLAQTTPFLFFTRWITHFCAPVFVFLSGTSAFLAGQRRKNKNELAKFLLTRGIWLIFLELTFVTFAWRFDITFSVVIFQVIWAIGLSMVVLSGLIYLPKKVILVIGFILVLGHNFLDPVNNTSILWAALHQSNIITLDSGLQLWLFYPVLPWIGTMALGYCFGSLYHKSFDPQKRKKVLSYLGVAAIFLFIVLRIFNLYGDPNPWSKQETFVFSLLSFFNTTKYPPSLLFLLMTIGPSLLLLRVTENIKTKAFNMTTTIGRVPLFYYILHLYLLHLFAVIAVLLSGFSWQEIDFQNYFGGLPPGYGFGLGVVYFVWVLVVCLLYPLCKKYDAYKRKSKSVWLSYL